MSTLVRINLSAFLFLLCATVGFTQVKADYDKSTDFSQYKTYTIGEWQDGSDKQLTDFDKKRILDALNSELAARGMTETETDPDCKIVLYLVLDNKTSTTAYTDFTGGMGMGPRWGWGMGAGMGSATTTYNEDDYTEGTFVVDMYDTSGKNLLWQGVTTKVVQSKPSKREKTIPKNMKKLMKKYPVDPL